MFVPDLRTLVRLTGLDFSEAFDKVNHSKQLTNKLLDLGIFFQLSSWLRCSPLNRTQQVVIDGEASK